MSNPVDSTSRVASPGRYAVNDLERLMQRLQARLDAMHADAEFPGATLGFVLADGRFASVSTGLADVERKTPLKSEDRMLAGSIGKTFVAAVALQLVDERKLNIDTKIERWFDDDDWFARLPNARDITIRHLMTHSSGIPEHVMNKDFIAAAMANPDRNWKPEELIRYILDAEPVFPAGQGFSYADTNYILVGMVIERITRKPLYAEIERRLLGPFKLSRTIPSDGRSLPGVITGYSRPDSPFPIRGRVIIDGRFVINPQLEWAGGGLASTAGDLSRWAWVLYGGKVFSKKSLENALMGVETGAGRGGGSGAKYGLGVQILNSPYGTTYGHAGWFPGYLSDMAYFPRQHVAIAVQFNTDAVQTLKRSPRAYIMEMARIIIGEPLGSDR